MSHYRSSRWYMFFKIGVHLWWLLLTPVAKTSLEDLSSPSKPSLKHHLTSTKNFFQTSSVIPTESVLLPKLNNKIKSFNKAVLNEQVYSLKTCKYENKSEVPHSDPKFLLRLNFNSKQAISTDIRSILKY